VKLSYSRALFVLSFAALVYLALRPDPRAERALDLLLLPTRALAEIAGPIRLLARSRVEAAETRLAEFGALELAASRELDAAERRSALPRDEKLRANRAFAHAQVLARVPGRLDRVLVELDPGAGALVSAGMPVVHGDVYVGRVACVHAERDQAAVDLVTGAAFFVGGRLETAAPAPPVRMVVGGLARLDGDDGLALGVHNPESMRGLAGRVRVEEADSRHEPYALQAAGFLLGSLRQVGEEQHEIEPELDYLHGLFRVVIVLPAGGGGAALAEPESRDVLSDGGWMRARVIGAFEPARWREGLKVDAGDWRGVRDGAAVVCAARLVGRVVHATPLASDVALLGDPGCAVPVLARVSGEEAPRVLGRLHSLGREDAGTLLLAWRPVTPIAADGAGPAELPAQLFTGSGELGVPRGLVIGDTFLPRGPGPHVLRVEQHVDTRDLEELWVRLAPELPGDCP
jgi:cell shape-determining protein MreC